MSSAIRSLDVLRLDRWRACTGTPGSRAQRGVGGAAGERGATAPSETPLAPGPTCGADRPRLSPAPRPRWLAQVNGVVRRRSSPVPQGAGTRAGAHRVVGGGAGALPGGSRVGGICRPGCRKRVDVRRPGVESNTRSMQSVGRDRRRRASLAAPLPAGRPAMCQGLRALQQSMTTYAGRFDARRLTAAQADEVVGLCAQIEASAASIKALAAARSAETNSWQHARLPLGVGAAGRPGRDEPGGGQTGPRDRPPAGRPTRGGRRRPGR